MRKHLCTCDCAHLLQPNMFLRPGHGRAHRQPMVSPPPRACAALAKAGTRPPLPRRPRPLAPRPRRPPRPPDGGESSEDCWSELILLRPVPSGVSTCWRCVEAAAVSCGICAGLTTERPPLPRPPPRARPPRPLPGDGGTGVPCWPGTSGDATVRAPQRPRPRPRLPPLPGLLAGLACPRPAAGAGLGIWSVSGMLTASAHRLGASAAAGTGCIESGSCCGIAGLIGGV